MRRLPVRLLTRIWMMLSVAILYIAMGGQAVATTIDFESLAHSDSGVDVFPGPYIESGFEFDTDGGPFGVWGSNGAGYAGSTALFVNNPPGTSTILTRAGGGEFELLSIDLAEVLTGTSQSVSVSFIGLKSDLSTVVLDFDLDGNHSFNGGFETVVFTGFTDLISVSWTQDADFHQYDQVVVNVVPEPKTALLVGFGLVGLSALRRR